MNCGLWIWLLYLYEGEFKLPGAVFRDIPAHVLIVTRWSYKLYNLQNSDLLVGYLADN